MKATYGSIETKGGIARETDYVEKLGTAYIVACPDCGRAARLPIPPFTFTREPLSIGPASVKLPCGWHGYLTDGIWKRSSDSKCGESRAMMEERKTANMANLKIGQSVTALRMSNKAVMIAGTIDALNDDGQTVVVKAVDSGGQEFLETVHVDDVTPAAAESSAKENGTATTTNQLAPHNTVADEGKGKRFTTVNGKAI